MPAPPRGFNHIWGSELLLSLCARPVTSIGLLFSAASIVAIAAASGSLAALLASGARYCDLTVTARTTSARLTRSPAVTKCQRHSVQASDRRPWRTTCSISPRERPISWSMASSSDCNLARSCRTRTSRAIAAAKPRIRSSTVRETRSMPRASEAERACTRAPMLSSIAAERARDECQQARERPIADFGACSRCSPSDSAEVELPLPDFCGLGSP